MILLLSLVLVIPISFFFLGSLFVLHMYVLRCFLAIFKCTEKVKKLDDFMNGIMSRLEMR